MEDMIAKSKYSGQQWNSELQLVREQRVLEPQMTPANYGNQHNKDEAINYKRKANYRARGYNNYDCKLSGL